MLKKLLLLFIVVNGLSCTPARIYKDKVVAKPIATKQKASTKVLAAVEQWRNSGVIVNQGDKYKISANGQWRTYGTCNFTDADGVGLYKAWCPNTTVYPPTVVGYSHSALIAKIGNNGQPFYIGNQRVISANNTGILYFRINDHKGTNHDNAGEVYVSIEAVSQTQRTTDQAIKHAFATNQKVSTVVSAAIEEWVDSGISINTGGSYEFSAKGRWKVLDPCNFTAADGLGLYKSGCPNWTAYPPIIKNQSHSALLAKVGRNGQPFFVGNKLQFKAEDTGSLYFRINDAPGHAFNNEGFVTVSVQSNHVLSTNNKAAKTLVYQQPIEELTQKISQNNTELPLEIVKKLTRRRTALIIGNSQYIDSPLKNPVNDASAMSSSLKSLGFDVVTLLDASQQQMEQAIDQFARKLISEQHVALFYYAGHGVQVDGENYLIPINAKINRQTDVKYKAVNVGQVLGVMGEASENLNIVILDACRNNPLPRSFRSSHRGLARLEGPKGTIIGFATSPGSVAADGEGDNGLYTHHFLANMKKPGLSIEEVFKRVLQGVNKDSNGQQTPWTESSFTGDFSFATE